MLAPKKVTVKVSERSKDKLFWVNLNQRQLPLAPQWE
jgi:hypothetical protein